MRGGLGPTRKAKTFFQKFNPEIEMELSLEKNKGSRLPMLFGRGE